MNKLSTFNSYRNSKCNLSKAYSQKTPFKSSDAGTGLSIYSSSKNIRDFKTSKVMSAKKPLKRRGSQETSHSNFNLSAHRLGSCKAFKRYLLRLLQFFIFCAHFYSLYQFLSKFRKPIYSPEIMRVSPQKFQSPIRSSVKATKK